MDGRLDNAIVGACLCIRPQFDLLQLWTKTSSSNTTVEVFTSRLQLLLGTKAQVTYQRLADAFSSKTSKARKYYLVEAMAATEDEAAMTVDNIVQPREFGNK